MRPLLLPVACIAVAVAPLALSACGSESPSAGTGTGTRAAAALSIVPSTRPCPDVSPSFTFTGTIVNRLAVPVTLQVGEYTCDDWSGRSTPGAVLTGRTIAAGGEITVTLEPRTYRNRLWTMEFVTADGYTSFGTARMSLPTSIGHPDWTTLGPKAYTHTWQVGNRTLHARFTPVGPTGARDTPADLLPRNVDDLGIAVHRRQVVLVTGASGPRRRVAV